MKNSLIICTYKRAEALLKLLLSVQQQTQYPNEILIIDGSPDDATKVMLAQNSFPNLQYFQVSETDRGLTKQRNYGIARVHPEMDIVSFLDDDTILYPNYLEAILATYQKFPEALGVGGYICNEVSWRKVPSDYEATANEFCFDGFCRTDGSRFVLRKKLGLDADQPPGFSPEFSHGRSVGFLPPSEKIYEVEQLMGGVSSFRKSVFERFQFSTYFQGYGLYEDADFTLRVAKTGKLYINTAAQLEHHHDAAGRPNQYHYGKMVVRNGWYVWRIKNPKPTAKAFFKWHAITLLLTFIRATNAITTTKKQEAITETCGRVVGWFSLFFNKPKLK